VIGELQGQIYEIELRLGHRNSSQSWNGTARLLRQDLQGMAGVRLTDKDQRAVLLTDGEFPVTLGANQSAYYKLSGTALQIGVLVIDSDTSSVGDLSPSFYYRVVDKSTGRVADLISIPPAAESLLAANTVIAQTNSLEVGIAIVGESGLRRPPGPNVATPVGVTAILDNGALLTATTTLGGNEPRQKSFFPRDALGALPVDVQASRLLLTSHERFYATALGLGLPPAFRDIQIGAAPVLPESTRNAPLRVLADLRGVHVGGAVQAGLLRETAYSATIARELNVITPENDLKFGPIHPLRATYNFANADAIVSFAEANAIQVRGHTLVWHSQLPSWVTGGTWTRDELIAVLREHILSVVGRYKGRVAYWDVVNEAIDDQGNLRNTIWLQVIGPDYIEMAFRWAHEADPDAKLFYNDYSAEALGTKSNAVYSLVQNLVQRGAPIHGVGFQGHFILSSPPRVQDISTNMARLAALGLEVHFTEVDIRIQQPFTEAKFVQQASLYASLTQACLAAANCKAFVLWGFTDKYSWIPSFFTGYGAALIFDGSYLPKPAYYALSDTLAGASPP
jgi:endo-1,4-beta-xylanase